MKTLEELDLFDVKDVVDAIEQRDRTIKELRKDIDAAVQQERERCAGICDKESELWTGIDDIEVYGRHCEANEIKRLILKDSSQSREDVKGRVI